MDLGDRSTLDRLRCLTRYAWLEAARLGATLIRYEASMPTMGFTLSGWQYWIEAPSAFRREIVDPVIGTLVLRPVEGDDIAIELCPGYAPGQAAQDELRLRIGEAVGDSEESQEIFDFTSFVLPDLIAARSARQPDQTSQTPGFL